MGPIDSLLVVLQVLVVALSLVVEYHTILLNLGGPVEVYLFLNDIPSKDMLLFVLLKQIMAPHWIPVYYLLYQDIRVMTAA